MPSGINKETGKSFRFKDRVGDRSGRLVFIKYLGVNKHKHGVWLAVCDCGNETTTSTPSKTKSCGCLRSEAMSRLGMASKQENPISRTKEYRKALKERHMSDPKNRMHARISRLHRHALSQVDAIKKSKTFDELGYSVDQFVSHIEKQFHGGMGWHNMDEWQIDHIIPISKAKNKDDVISLNQLSNLRPMWSQENNKKRNKVEFLI